jgi:hypothetical protein
VNSTSEVLSRLADVHIRDGSCEHDQVEMRELLSVHAKEPSVLVSHTAIQHGVNAGQLSSWIYESLLFEAIAFNR